MTTLIGLKAAKGKPGIVLASDLQATRDNWDTRGDVAYRKQERTESQKIYVDKRRNFAFCMTGIADSDYVDFLVALRDGKINLETAIEQGFLPEFERLHLKRFGGKSVRENRQSSLLVASRFNGNLGLYGVYPMGKVESTEAVSLGSGQEHVESYVSGQKVLLPHDLTIKRAIDLADRGLDAATKDVYTGGKDLVVVTSEAIYEFGRRIKSAVDKAEKAEIQAIKDQF